MDADEWTPKYDPKKHITALLRQAKEILDKAVDDAEAAEDIEAYCLPLLFEIANIYFYLGLLGSNIRLHLVSFENEENDTESSLNQADRNHCGTCTNALIIRTETGDILADCKIKKSVRNMMHQACKQYSRDPKKRELACGNCRLYHEDCYTLDGKPHYNCTTVGHTVDAVTPACFDFCARPDIVVDIKMDKTDKTDEGGRRAE